MFRHSYIEAMKAIVKTCGSLIRSGRTLTLNTSCLIYLRNENASSSIVQSNVWVSIQARLGMCVCWIDHAPADSALSNGDRNDCRFDIPSRHGEEHLCASRCLQ